MLTSIVICNFNSGNDLAACLLSLETLSSPFELIIVDNNSSDGSADFAQCQAATAMQLIRLPNNTGYCYANNIGYKKTQGDIILFLNPDVRLTGDYVDTLVGHFQRPDVGLVTGKLLRFDRRTVDSCGQRLTCSGRCGGIGYGRQDSFRYRRPRKVFGVCGAALMISQTAARRLAGRHGELFDESFFAFFEDLDLGWRARNLGFIALFDPHATALHRRASGVGGKTTGRLFDRYGADIQEKIICNRYRAWCKNARWFDLIPRLPCLIAFETIQWTYLALRYPQHFARWLRSAKMVVRNGLRKRLGDRKKR